MKWAKLNAKARSRKDAKEGSPATHTHYFFASPPPLRFNF